MGASQREAEAILEQKRKYWQKVLSEDAIETNIFRMFDVFDQASFWGDWVLSDTLFSSLIGLVFFDLPISDFVPWNLMWEITLPDIDEFLRGVLIKLEPISITDLFPDLSSVFGSLSTFMTPEAAWGIEGTRLKKAYWGVTKYGEGYLDPPAVREFLRSTLYAFLKKDITLEEAKRRVQAAAEQLNLASEIVQDVFNRLSMISAIKEKAATWDFAWWDVTEWAEEGSGGYLEFTSWDLTPEKVEYEQMWDVEGGAWWDMSLWDYCFWTDDVSPYAMDWERKIPVIIDIVDTVIFNWRRRIHTTALAAANYQRAEERRYSYTSSRTETYAVPTSAKIRVESIVENIVRKMEKQPTAFKLRLYKSAALEMFGKLYGVHRWGAEMEKAMSELDFKEYWLTKWSSEGLDRAVLEVIYQSVRPIIDALGTMRVENRVRFLRERLRKY